MYWVSWKRCLRVRPVDGRDVVDDVRLAGGQRRVALDRIGQELPDDLVHDRRALVLRGGRPGGVVRVLDQIHLLPVLPLLHLERAGPDRLIAVRGVAALERGRRLDAEVGLAEHRQERQVRLGQRDLQVRRVERGRLLEVRVHRHLRGAVAALLPVAEVVGERLGVERRAVGELHPGLEGEGVGLAGVAHLPGRGEPRLDRAVVGLGDDGVEDVAVDVGLLQPAAVEARRLLLVAVDDGAAGHLRTAVGAGGRAAGGLARGQRGGEQGRAAGGGRGSEQQGMNTGHC